MATPNVNFFLDFYLPQYKNPKKQDERDYYSSHKANDYVKYVATGIEDLKNIDYVEYTNNRTKTSGIFNQNGILNKEQIALMRKNLRDTKSVIWSGLISFEEKFGKTWCNCHEQAENLLISELPKFFKRVGLKPENIEWFAGLHENTDNRHIHFIFFEKQPLRMKNEKRVYSIGRLSKRHILGFKPILELAATDFKAREIKVRTSLTKNFKSELNDISSIKLRGMLIDLASNLPTEGHTYYSCDNMQSLRPKIDQISNYILNTNKNLNLYKQDFDSLVKEKDDLIENYAIRNKCDKPIGSCGDKYYQDLYRRLGNEIINKAKDIKREDDERLKLNAKYKSQKIAQKRKLKSLLNECMYLNDKVEYEAIKAFQDYFNKLEEMRMKDFIKEGLIEEAGYEMY